ncbi:MAG: outer membrane beta-barrel domain-containing protein [Pseudomonadales bacterium]|jgi:outer membrane beta-barrel protein
MERRIQHIFLSGATVRTIVLALITTGSLAIALPAAAAKPKAEDLNLEPLVVREPERREVKVDRIDSENFEIGIAGGLMNVQDFGTDFTTSVWLAYHVTEGFFVEGQYGKTTLGQTSFERLSGGADLLTDAQRDMRYYNVSVGYNLFPGESFLGRRWAFKGGLYLIGGVGSSDFAGDERFTVNAGLGYRLVATDWLAFHVTVRDHMFESDLLGSKDTYHNIEFTGSLSLFF